MENDGGARWGTMGNDGGRWEMMGDDGGTSSQVILTHRPVIYLH